MLRTAYSQILNSSRDFSIAIFDGRGNLVSQADNLPVHVGGLPLAMNVILEHFDGRIAEGDVYIVNDPYHGGSHLPDITCFVPVFVPGSEAPVFWAVNRAHASDIGGSAPGSYNPAATEIWHEGLRITPIRLYREGARDDDLFYMPATNVRHFTDFKGDLDAMVGSARNGARRLFDLTQEYGIGTISQCIESILDASEQETRADILTWRDGVFKGVSYLDDDGHDARDIAIRATVTVEGSSVTIDLSESDCQVAGIVNSSKANTISAAQMAIAYLTSPHIAKNAGSFRAVKVVTKPGTVVDPHAPAPVTLSTNHPAQEIAEAVFSALAGSCPDRVVGGWGRRFRIALQGTDPRTGKGFIWHLFQARPGGGASSSADGWHGAGELSSGGGLKFGSIEVTEARFPFFFEEHQFVPETAGAGRHRGGFGARLRMRLETREVVEGVTAGDGVRHSPRGIAGGEDGKGHRYIRIPFDGGAAEAIPTKAVGLRFKPGDVIEVVSSGGGGYGRKEERSDDLRRKDRIEGFAAGESE